MDNIEVSIFEVGGSDERLFDGFATVDEAIAFARRHSVALHGHAVVDATVWVNDVEVTE